MSSYWGTSDRLGATTNISIPFSIIKRSAMPLSTTGLLPSGFLYYSINVSIASHNPEQSASYWAIELSVLLHEHNYWSPQYDIECSHPILHVYICKEIKTVKACLQLWYFVLFFVSQDTHRQVHIWDHLVSCRLCNTHNLKIDAININIEESSHFSFKGTSIPSAESQWLI